MKRIEIGLIIFFAFLISFSIGYLVGIKILDYKIAHTNNIHTTIRVEV